jgi:glycosyltransferase involved in cell wall biosynthesis
LRILELITPSRLGGAERYVGWISKEFERQGHEVLIGIRPCAPVEAFYESLNLNVETLAISGKFNPFASRRLRALIARYRPDVVHTHLSTASYWGLRAARRLRVPGYGHVHAFNTVFPYRAASNVIAVSEAVRKHLVAKGIRAEKINIVHPASEIQCPMPAADIAALDGKVIACASRLRTDKGIRVAFEAFARVSKKCPDTWLVLCGDGPLLQALKSEATDRKLQVLLTGYRDDVPNVFAASDIAVLPSLRPEGYGLSLVEAQAVGTPVVASAVGGACEAMVDGKTGIGVAPGNVERLSAALAKLLVDDEARKCMGRAAADFASTRTVEASSRQLIRAFSMPAAAPVPERDTEPV